MATGRPKPLGRPKSKPQDMLSAVIGPGVHRPFVAPDCPRCGARLADRYGNPRWDVVGRLTFVCLDGCAPARARRTADLA
jgi:hypothetical protein